MIQDYFFDFFKGKETTEALRTLRNAEKYENYVLSIIIVFTIIYRKYILQAMRL
jgi:hypothetical protein